MVNILIDDEENLWYVDIADIADEVQNGNGYGI